MGDEGHEDREREREGDEGDEGHEGREREREGDEGHEGREREREGDEGDEGQEVSWRGVIGAWAWLRRVVVSTSLLLSVGQKMQLDLCDTAIEDGLVYAEPAVYAHLIC